MRALLWLGVLAGSIGCGRIGFGTVPDAAVDAMIPAGAAIVFHFDEDSGKTTRSDDGVTALLVGIVPRIPGVRGNAVEVGPNGYVDVPPRGELALAGAITISIWYQLYSTLAVDDCAPLVVHAGASPTDPADNVLYALDLEPPRLVLYAERQARRSDDTGAPGPVDAFSAGTWHHLVVVRDDAPNVRFYFDGGPAISAPAPQAVDGGYAGHLRIGGGISSSAGACAAFPGSLDELYIYPRALDPAEVQRLYQAR